MVITDLTRSAIIKGKFIYLSTRERRGRRRDRPPLKLGERGLL